MSACAIVERYRAWRRAGLCGRCGKTPSPERALCAPCNEKATVWRELRRARRADLRTPKHRAWTTGELRRLVEAYKRGEAVRDIGAALGRTVAAVEWRVAIMGLSRPRLPRWWTAERVGVLRELHAKWATHAEIGEYLGVSAAAACEKALKLGLRRGRGARVSRRLPQMDAEVARRAA